MKKGYYTVDGEGAAEIVEKKSRFITSVKYIERESEAVDFIETLRKKHWNASHNVYAYILENDNTARFSDDGEPSGTAGLPVLEALKKEGLSNAVVVVTRYFGGTLLGTGGLVRAYAKAAKAGIDSAGIVCVKLCAEILVECDYVMLGKIQNEAVGLNVVLRDIEYSDNVKLTACVPVDLEDVFGKSMTEVTFGRIKMEKIAEEYMKTGN